MTTIIKKKLPKQKIYYEMNFIVPIFLTLLKIQMEAF
jgi:hypothetical protein